MHYGYPTGIWDSVLLSERRRRDYEEATGRLAAGISRRVHKARRAVGMAAPSPGAAARCTVGTGLDD